MTVPGRTVVTTGDEEFLRARQQDETVAAFTTASGGDVTVVRLSAENLSDDQVAQALEPDLFGGLPVVIISDGQKLAKPVLGLLTHWCAAPGEALLIVDVVKSGEAAAANKVVTALKTAGATVHETNAPKAADRRKFAGGELRRVGLAGDGEAERLLAECEPDLRGIAMRAEQVAADLGVSPGGKVRVSADRVAAVVSSTGTTSGFVVADALAGRDPRALAAALDQAAATATPGVMIVSACLGVLRDIAAVQHGATGKMPPWKQQKAQRNARRWSGHALARAVGLIGGAHPALGWSGRRDADLPAALMRAVVQDPDRA